MRTATLRVLITGSNRGIGRVTARHFAGLGARVALNGRDRARTDAVCDELRADGHDVVSVVGDLSVPTQAAAIVDGAVAKLGGLDVLVNNAAVAMRGPFEELDVTVVDAVIGTNVSGTLMVTLHALPHLKKSGGSVVFISSLAGLWGFPLISVYSASKMALTAVAQSLRTELSGSGIHVGIVYVGITQHDADKAILRADGSPYPLAPRPRACTQERVARAVYTLVSRRRFRVVLTPAGHLLDVVARFFPRILSGVLGRSAGRVDRLAR